MTPKEKAKELFDKYGTYVVMWSGGITTQRQNCKQCALICVDEIIKYQDSLLCMLDTDDGSPVDFWENVKQEIEKL